MKPVHSLREKNMLYGIQDFNIFKQLEEKFGNLEDKLKEKLAIHEVIRYQFRNLSEHE